MHLSKLVVQLSLPVLLAHAQGGPPGASDLDPNSPSIVPDFTAPQGQPGKSASGDTNKDVSNSAPPTSPPPASPPKPASPPVPAKPEMPPPSAKGVAPELPDALPKDLSTLPKSIKPPGTPTNDDTSLPDATLPAAPTDLPLPSDLAVPKHRNKTASVRHGNRTTTGNDTDTDLFGKTNKVSDSPASQPPSTLNGGASDKFGGAGQSSEVVMTLMLGAVLAAVCL